MVKIIKTLGKLYISLIALNVIAAMPAKSNKKEKIENTSNSDTTIIEPLSQRQKCHPNTKSCDDGYSCIRFNSDKEDEYTCIKNEVAFCDNNDYCESNLGPNYKFCYIPPWKKGNNAKKQCFTEQPSGSPCLYDIHCVNTLSCIDNICVSSRVGDLNDTSNSYDFEGKPIDKGTILGINKWVFIAALSFPAIVLLLCLWCWFIGRSSSKHIENQKKARYEKEIKDLTMPDGKDKSGSETPKYDPQKEIEEEVGKRSFRSLFSRKKGEDITPVKKDDKEESIDISTTKVGGKAPINTSTTSDTQQKMKKNLSLTNVNEKNTRTKKGTKVPTTPGGSSAASFAVSSTSSSSKPRGTKKKAATGAKKVKKATSSTGNDTNTNSTSSKQSSQRGLVNNASNMSSALSGQSASYFSSSVSSLDPQSALYYQQMYNAAAAQVAAQNPYYASYMQNPYYAAAAAQNAAYYAQDPNAVYGAYQNQTSF